MVWSNPQVQSLTKKFVAVADELHDLRTGTSKEAEFFQDIFQQKEKHPGHQGVFLATPSGRLLASSTCYEAEKVKALLRDGLEKWNKLSTEERLQPNGDLLGESVGDRASDFYPEDGLVLRVTVRDLPADKLTASRNPRWHRYYVWFNRAEVDSMLPQRVEAGQTRVVPNELSTRIATLALLDKGRVDGFTRPFRDADVVGAKLIFTVVEADEFTVRLEISGITATKTRDAQAFISNMPKYEDIPQYRGVKTSILGKATFDRDSRRFVEFQMIATGTRVGGAYVGRAPDDWGQSPIGFSFALGQSSPAERIAPEFPGRYPWLTQLLAGEDFADSGQGLDGRNDKGRSVGQYPSVH